MQQMIDDASERVPAIRKALPLGFLMERQSNGWQGIGAELLRLFGEVSRETGMDVKQLIDLSNGQKHLGQIAQGFGSH
eukprot:SAG31_NODE_4010_length_3667_cov_2.004484_4_plen_78_part_00